MPRRKSKKRDLVWAALIAVAVAVAVYTLESAPQANRQWTAPTDYIDAAHTQTRAIMQYDGRLSTDPDSLVNDWQNCTQWLDHTYIPGPPGTPESYQVPDSLLPSGNVYFAIWAIDSAFNRSAISNTHHERIDYEPPDNVTDLK